MAGEKIFTLAQATALALRAANYTADVAAAAAEAYQELDTAKQGKLSWDDAPTEGSANAVSSGAVYAALQNAGGVAYSRNFTSSDWTSSGSEYTMSIPAATHGCGTMPLVQVLRLNGSAYQATDGYPTTGFKLSVAASGNVTLTTTAAFAGRVVVR